MVWNAWKPRIVTEVSNCKAYHSTLDFSQKFLDLYIFLIYMYRTYKNLEKRVILECDGESIPLPSLQGIVVLNISSFMGGTNFWGNAKEDGIFLPSSFDDGILEVISLISYHSKCHLK